MFCFAKQHKHMEASLVQREVAHHRCDGGIVKTLQLCKIYATMDFVNPSKKGGNIMAKNSNQKKIALYIVSAVLNIIYSYVISCWIIIKMISPLISESI